MNALPICKSLIATTCFKAWTRLTPVLTDGQSRVFPTHLAQSSIHKSDPDCDDAATQHWQYSTAAAHLLEPAESGREVCGVSQVPLFRAGLGTGLQDYVRTTGAVRAQVLLIVGSRTMN